MRDPLDPTSTFWNIHVIVRNLGHRTALITFSDWQFESKLRGKFTSKDFPERNQTLTVLAGKPVFWTIRFVMSPEYHIPALINGKDSLSMNFSFTSKDMAGIEESFYQAAWRYTKGSFSLITDERRYKIADAKPSQDLN